MIHISHHTSILVSPGPLGLAIPRYPLDEHEARSQRRKIQALRVSETLNPGIPLVASLHEE